MEILLWHWGGSLDLRCLLHWLHLLDRLHLLRLHLLGLHLLGLHRLRLHLLRRNLLGLNLLRLHWRNLFYLDWLLRQLFWDYLRRWRLFNWLRLLLRDCWNGWRLGLSWLLSVLALLSHLLCRDLVRLLHLHLGHLLLSVVDLALVVGLLHWGLLSLHLAVGLLRRVVRLWHWDVRDLLLVLRDEHALGLALLSGLVRKLVLLDLDVHRIRLVRLSLVRLGLVRVIVGVTVLVIHWTVWK